MSWRTLSSFRASVPAKRLLDVDLWTLIVPLLLPRTPRRFRHQGRKPLDKRVALTGILFVLKSGIPWEMQPAELGCCGLTCCRRLCDWRQAGVWEQLNATVLYEPRRREQLDLSRAVVDSSSALAILGRGAGPNPTDRRNAGSKHHVITDAQGVPMASIVTGASTTDVTHLLPLVDAVSAIGSELAAPRGRPQRAQSDRAYGPQAHRQAFAKRGLKSGRTR